MHRQLSRGAGGLHPYYSICDGYIFYYNVAIMMLGLCNKSHEVQGLMELPRVKKNLWMLQQHSPYRLHLDNDLQQRKDGGGILRMGSKSHISYHL